VPVSLWCILITALLPALSLLPAKIDKSFDNARPRDPEYWKSGFRARARAAHANGYEAFPFFAVAVIVGLWQGGDADWITRLAVLFVAMRLIYIGSYWADRATPRSIAWGAGHACIVAIFTSPVWS